MATLTQANPQYLFNGGVGATKSIGTSGPIGGGTIKLQYRVEETDDWVDNPNLDFSAGEHLSVIVVLTTVFNRVVVEGADGTTELNIQG